MVYLLHFNKKYHHAGHYIGTANDICKRLHQHNHGRGARLMQVISEAGITFLLARTWEGGRQLERQLKNRHEAPRLCPICIAKRKEAKI